MISLLILNRFIFNTKLFCCLTLYMYKFMSKHHHMWIKTIELHNDSTKVSPVPRRVLQGEVCNLAERMDNMILCKF